MPRPIRLNAFDMNCVAHQSPGLWRHPEDRARDCRKLSYWTHRPESHPAAAYRRLGETLTAGAAA